MNKISLVLFFMCVCCCNQLIAQCQTGQQHVRLIIDPDTYFDEESWIITNVDSSIVYATGHCTSEYRDTFDYCLPDSVCMTFHIKDVNGDGMFPDGYYRLERNGVLVHENIGCNYNYGEIVHFDCLPGTICDNPLSIDTGTWTTPKFKNSWYLFTPHDTGTYLISTCNLGNTCPSRIWVYSFCNSSQQFSNLLGADYYSESGCQNGADATLYLPGGKHFYIRLAYKGDSCLQIPLKFSLKYLGPIHGCRDKNACNYNPLATVNDTCVYPGSPLCTRYPDLKVLQSDIINSEVFDLITNADPCNVLEGCLRGMGPRRVIKFTTHIQNVGDADYFIGSPPSSPDSLSTEFIFDPCHHHWHYRGYAEYVLYNSIGGLIPVGSKNGFCVEDFVCLGGGIHKFSCANMGITPGCDDLYDYLLPCQWIDITDIPPGDYTMIVRVNWDQKPDKLGRVEKSYLNNWAQACFSLAYDLNNQPKVEFKEDQCPPFVDCAGTPYGNSLPDCNGICNGSTKRGDLNQDTILNAADVQLYLNDALNGNTTASPCTDLFEDNQITVYDAALLQECNLHGDSVNYWYLRFPCRFPSGFVNIQDFVSLLAGPIDTAAKTFDVQVVNPNNSLIGYEFYVTGLTIDAVENLAPGFSAPIQFNASTGSILALSPTETPIPKHDLPSNLLRIHYKNLTSTKACVANIISIVNSKYQQSTATVGIPGCTLAGLTGTNNPYSASSVFVESNPFSTQATIYFSNPDLDLATATLSDITGRVLRTYPGFRDKSITIERGDLVSGVYVCTIQTKSGIVVGKLIAQ
jgi:hypothetical protein